MQIEWEQPHILKIGNEISTPDNPNEDTKNFRSKIEPWLSALFQSEHLSLLLGSGLTTAITHASDIKAQGMDRVLFTEYGQEIKQMANKQASEMERGSANLEDDFRVAIELYKGLLICNPTKAAVLKTELDKNLLNFIENILATEKAFTAKIKSTDTLNKLKSFLISFASRTASRDRLHIFTTNYDRFIEYACDMAGILTLDRFVGKISPVFRSRMELDYHYNPPGIRGEPRYVEGVVRYTKLHGSLDWKFELDEIIKSSIPFGADKTFPEIPTEPFGQAVIYPNAAKGVETVYYPYSELFRDFSTATCRPNSVLITYGYGFGDSHINRIIKDMLSIPSTHLVVISFDNASGRIEKFLNDVNSSQITILMGNHFGNFSTLIENYLPKSAIDKITQREQKIRAHRGEEHNTGPEAPEHKSGNLDDIF